MIGHLAALGATFLVGAVVDPLGPVDQDPDGPRDLACELTASDRICRPPAPDEPIDFDSPGGEVVAAGNWASTVVVVILVAVLLAVVVWLVTQILKSRSTGSDDTVDDLDEDFDDDRPAERIIDVEQPPAKWRRLADEHRRAGQYRDAVRCDYRALVGDLARAGLVDEIPGRTSGEERTQVDGLATAIAPTFAAAADVFDAAWFDDDEVTADDDQRFTAAAQSVLDAVSSGRHMSAMSLAGGES